MNEKESGRFGLLSVLPRRGRMYLDRELETFCVRAGVPKTLIILMPRSYGLDGVWLSFPVADLITFIITMVFVLLEWKKMPKAVPIPFKRI